MFFIGDIPYYTMPLALGCWFWGQIGTYLYLYSIKLIRFYLIYHNPTCCWCIRSTGWCCRCQCRWCCQWFFKQTISGQLLLYVIKQVQNAANGCSSWISGLFTHFFSWHFGSSSTFDEDSTLHMFDIFDTFWEFGHQPTVEIFDTVDSLQWNCWGDP